MKITINRPDSQVGVDGTFSCVSLEGLDPAIESVQFDTELNEGLVEYLPTATRPITVRDFVLEDREYRDALANNKDIRKLEPRYKSIQVQRAAEAITSFNYEPFYQRWLEQQQPKEAGAQG